MPPRQQAADDELLDCLVQISFSVMRVLSQVAATHDLSLTQLRVLAILRDREPNLVQLAAHLGLERSSVSGLVDRAVRRGLVRREANVDDGRAVRLGLTPAGEALVRRGAQEIALQLAPLTAALRPAEQQRLAALLQRLLA